VVLSFSSWAGSFSVLILVSTSWIFVSTVVSSWFMTIGVVACSAVSPSLRIMTFFWHLAHHKLPFLSLKSGEAQAGHEYSVSVAPCRRRSAMFCRVFDLFDIS